MRRGCKSTFIKHMQLSHLINTNIKVKIMANNGDTIFAELVGKDKKIITMSGKVYETINLVTHQFTRENKAQTHTRAISHICRRKMDKIGSTNSDKTQWPVAFFNKRAAVPSSGQYNHAPYTIFY